MRVRKWQVEAARKAANKAHLAWHKAQRQWDVKIAQWRELNDAYQGQRSVAAPKKRGY